MVLLKEAKHIVPIQVRATILGTRHGRVDDTEDIIRIANLLVEDEVFVNKPGRSFSGLSTVKVGVEASGHLSRRGQGDRWWEDVQHREKIISRWERVHASSACNAFTANPLLRTREFTQISVATKNIRNNADINHFCYQRRSR